MSDGTTLNTYNCGNRIDYVILGPAEEDVRRRIESVLRQYGYGYGTTFSSPVRDGEQWRSAGWRYASCD